MLSLRSSDVAERRNQAIPLVAKNLMNDKELGDEEFRIRRVYAERKRVSPSDRYSSRNPGNLLIREELERHLLSNLTRFAQTKLSIWCYNSRFSAPFSMEHPSARSQLR